MTWDPSGLLASILISILGGIAAGVLVLVVGLELPGRVWGAGLPAVYPSSSLFASSASSSLTRALAASTQSTVKSEG